MPKTARSSFLRTAFRLAGLTFALGMVWIAKTWANNPPPNVSDDPAIIYTPTQTIVNGKTVYMPFHEGWTAESYRQAAALDTSPAFDHDVVRYWAGTDWGPWERLDDQTLSHAWSYSPAGTITGPTTIQVTSTWTDNDDPAGTQDATKSKSVSIQVFKLEVSIASTLEICDIKQVTTAHPIAQGYQWFTFVNASVANAPPIIKYLWATNNLWIQPTSSISPGTQVVISTSTSSEGNPPMYVAGAAPGAAAVSGWIVYRPYSWDAATTTTAGASDACNVYTASVGLRSKRGYGNCFEQLSFLDFGHSSWTTDLSPGIMTRSQMLDGDTTDVQHLGHWDFTAVNVPAGNPLTWWSDGQVNTTPGYGEGSYHKWGVTLYQLRPTLDYITSKDADPPDFWVPGHMCIDEALNVVGQAGIEVDLPGPVDCPTHCCDYLDAQPPE